MNNLKIFFLAFFITFIFCLTINLFEASLKDIFFYQLAAKNPQILTAQVYQPREFYPRKIKSQPEEIEINAQSVISFWFNGKGRERILLEKNSSEKMPVASLTKLMTALVVSEVYSPNDLPSLEEILNVMLIHSNNEAAFNLASHFNENGLVELMNLKAENLALINTHFANPAGLDDPEQFSTAEDLVKLAKYILKEKPELFEITIKKNYQDKENTNELLEKIPEIIGGKTGETTQAKGCLLLLLKAPNNRGYIVDVILGADERFVEMEKLINWQNNNYVWQ